jgi:hypothetical protein
MSRIGHHVHHQHHHRHSTTDAAAATTSNRITAQPLKRHASASNINDRATKHHTEVQPAATTVTSTAGSTLVGDTTTTTMIDDIVQSVLLDDLNNEAAIDRDVDTSDIDGARYWQDEMMTIADSKDSGGNACVTQVIVYIANITYTAHIILVFTLNLVYSRSGLYQYYLCVTHIGNNNMLAYLINGCRQCTQGDAATTTSMTTVAATRPNSSMQQSHPKTRSLDISSCKRTLLKTQSAIDHHAYLSDSDSSSSMCTTASSVHTDSDSDDDEPIGDIIIEAALLPITAKSTATPAIHHHQHDLHSHNTNTNALLRRHSADSIHTTTSNSSEHYHDVEASSEGLYDIQSCCAAIADEIHTSSTRIEAVPHTKKDRTKAHTSNKHASSSVSNTPAWPSLEATQAGIIHNLQLIAHPITTQPQHALLED